MDNIEDVKEELAVIAKFLNEGYFGQHLNEKETNLLVELVVMKLKALSE